MFVLVTCTGQSNDLKKVMYSVVELRNAREVKDPKGGVGGGLLPQQTPVNSSPSMSPSSLTEGQVRQSVWRRGR